MSKAGIEYIQNKPYWSQRVYRYKEDIVMWNIVIGGSCCTSSSIIMTIAASYNLWILELHPGMMWGFQT